jgi:spermidine/putrescine transport system substrate-binding protein
MKREEADRMFADFLTGALDRRAFVTRLFAAGASATSVAALLQACGGAPREAEKKEEAAPPDPDKMNEIGTELSIYNWSDYIAEDTVPKFEKETGIKVTYTTYESNEEMMAKLQVGAGGYDIVVPTGYIVTVLAAQNLLYPLRKDLLTNWVNVAPMFANPDYDPGNKYGVPWQWGTTGIAYRSDKVAAAPDSWAVFHDTKLKGKMTMMDDQRDVIGAWLKFAGKSLNSTDTAELQQAKADAIKAKANLKAYVSAPVKSQLIAGDVWVAQLWDGDTMQAKAEQEAIAYTLPKEGAGIWTDSLVIPASAPHKRAAHEFMNFILRPEIGAEISTFTGYGTPNSAAMAKMEAPVPYPSADDMKRLEYQKDLGEANQAWDQLWTEIKSA